MLISGGGTTLRNLIEKIAAGQLRAEIAAVVSSNAEAKGLQLRGRSQYSDARRRAKGVFLDEEFSAAVFDRCRAAGAELVVMGGLLKQVAIPDDFANRVINIHPALIPSFCGKGMYGPRVHRGRA